MSKFASWCKASTEDAGAHKVKILTAEPAKLAEAVKSVSETIPFHYVSEARAANLLGRLGKEKAAHYLTSQLPTTKAVRSGDLGEILGMNYLEEYTAFRVEIKKLRWKDHRNMAMRGEDVLAFAVEPATGRLLILKGEAKSRQILGATTVKEARVALAANNGRPSAHALAFFASRYFEAGNQPMTNLLDGAQLNGHIGSDQMTHMMFMFTGNDPGPTLRADLKTYVGKIEQLSVGVRVQAHQDFIGSVFATASRNGL